MFELSCPYCMRPITLGSRRCPHCTGRLKDWGLSADDTDGRERPWNLDFNNIRPISTLALHRFVLPRGHDGLAFPVSRNARNHAGRAVSCNGQALGNRPDQGASFFATMIVASMFWAGFFFVTELQRGTAIRGYLRVIFPVAALIAAYWMYDNSTWPTRALLDQIQSDRATTQSAFQEQARKEGAPLLDASGNVRKLDVRKLKDARIRALPLVSGSTEVNATAAKTTSLPEERVSVPPLAPPVLPLYQRVQTQRPKLEDPFIAAGQDTWTNFVKPILLQGPLRIRSYGTVLLRFVSSSPKLTYVGDGNLGAISWVLARLTAAPSSSAHVGDDIAVVLVPMGSWQLQHREPRGRWTCGIPLWIRWATWQGPSHHQHLRDFGEWQRHSSIDR